MRSRSPRASSMRFLEERNRRTADTIRQLNLPLYRAKRFDFGYANIRSHVRYPPYVRLHATLALYSRRLHHPGGRVRLHATYSSPSGCPPNACYPQANVWTGCYTYPDRWNIDFCRGTSSSRAIGCRMENCPVKLQSIDLDI